MKTVLKNKFVWIITVLMILAAAGMFFLTQQTFLFAQDSFITDGFILEAATDEDSAIYVNNQYYFNKDVKFLKKQDGTIQFNTINGENVSVSKNNFVHFSDLSMCALSKSVLIDADALKEDQIVYYSVAKNSVVEKRNEGYAVSSGSEVLNFSNFIWKISASNYTVVSNTIKLVVDEDSTQTFSDFIQIEYIKDGVVHLVNQDGTYSTISSGAYLELENGVRIYLGSKNITDSESILMNMGQMIVNADDEVETDPDTYYKKETDRTPRIVVEASDGKDGTNGKAGTPGEAGENGDNGTNGDNGENGSTGAQGNKGAAGAPGAPGSGGDPGKDGTNSDVQYVEETMPIFTANLQPSAYGVSSRISYTEKNCNINTEKTYISIIETATGNEVWRFHPNTIMKSTGFDVNCNTLKQETNYTFAITCEYTPLATGKSVTQTVYTKFFTTLTVGVELKLKYVTENKIYAEIVKTADTVVSSLTVRCYDSAKTSIKGVAVPTSYMNYDLSGSIHLPETMSIGDSIEVLIDQLDRNTVYFLRIEEVQVSDGLSTDIQKCITDSFPYVKAKTLKRAPSLGKPEITVLERNNAFVITPINIVDIDNGVISYTYEIYKAENVITGANNTQGFDFNGSPVYSSTQSNATDVAVPIDGTIIKRGVNYYARILAKFDNNEIVVDYSSPLSDMFCAGESNWPQVINSYDSDFLTASTIEGQLNIIDTYKTIKPAYGLSVFYRSDTQVDGKTLTGTIRVDQSIIDNAEISGGIYEINYFESGLRQDTEYTIYVYAGLVTVNGKEYTNVLVGTASFHTGTYSPLLIEYIDYNATSSSGQNAINLKVKLSASDTARESSLGVRTTGTKAQSQGLNNMGDFSGKALHIVKMELFVADTDGKPTTTRLGSPAYFVDENYRGTDGIFRFGENLDSMYNKFYLPSANAALTVTENTFNVPISTIQTYQTTALVIKVSAYDYCYDSKLANEPDTANYTLFGSDNIIPIGTDKGFVKNSDYDAYIELGKVKDTLPSIPAELKYNYLIKNNVKTQEKLNKYSAQNPDANYRSNYETAATGSGLTSLLQNVYSGTDVGLVLRGHSSMIASANYVRYTIYKTTSGGVYSDSVAQSSWIGQSGGSWYPWTFFYNIDDETYQGSANAEGFKATADGVGRGEDYYVVVEYQLKNQYSYLDADNNPVICQTFPTEFQHIAFGYRKQDSAPYFFIAEEFLSKKQAPSFYLAEKNGTKDADSENESLKASYYLDYIDLDKALLLSNTKVMTESGITVSAPAFFAAVDQYDDDYNKEDTAINILDADLSVINAGGEVPVHILDNVKLSNKAGAYSKKLYVKYALTSGASVYNELKILDNKNIINRASTYLEFITPASIYATSDFINFFNEHTKSDFSSGSIVVSSVGDEIILTAMVAVEDNSAFGSVNVTLNKVSEGAIDTSPEATLRLENVHFESMQRLTTKLADNSSYNVFELSIRIPASQLISHANETNLQCSIELVYDSGHFGLDYVKEPMYVLQLNNNAIYSNNAKFSDSVISTGTVEADAKTVAFGKQMNDATGVLSRFVSMQGYSSSVEFWEEGLELIPREVKSDTIVDHINLEYVLPSVSGTITPGISVAKFDMLFGSENTLEIDGDGKNIMIEYSKAGSSATQSAFLYVPPQQVSEQSLYIENLTPDTLYNVKIYAFMGASNGYKEVTGRSTFPTSFRTLAELAISMEKFVFNAPTTAPGDKNVVVSAHTATVLRKDLENTVEKVSVRIMDKNKHTLDTVAYSGAQLLELYDQVNSGGAFGWFSFSSKFNWSQKPEHLMNGSEEYFAYAEVKYRNIGQTTKSAEINTKPKTWQGQGSYQIVRGTYSIEPGTGNYQMTVSVSAQDDRRIFCVEEGAEEVKVKSVLTLYKVDSQTGKVGDTPIDTATIYLKYNDANGNITSKSHVFTGLQPNTTYIAYSEMKVDFDNDGDFTDPSYKETDSSGFTTYKIGSGKNTTPGTSTVVLNYVSLSPSKSEATLYGANLGSIQKLVYRLYIGGSTDDTLDSNTLIFGDPDNSKRLQNFYSSFEYSENCYILKVPPMNDANMNYVLEVELYTNATDVIPAVQSTGTYTASSGPLRGALSYFMNNLF